MVTKEAFERYEKVRKAGTVNMLDAKVRVLASITKDEQNYIVRHYSELDERFSNAEPMGEVSYEDVEEMFSEDSVDALAVADVENEKEVS